MKFNKVDSHIVEKLIEIVGKNNVIYGDEERLKPFSHDEVAESSYFSMPEVVVKPGLTAEVSQIMKLANKYQTPVTPRGAGSGLSGGAIPVHGGIVLSFERMNRILEIDLDNLIIVVEPGVVTNTINETLREHGLMFAGYPMSIETCYIGGNVAENAGGGKAIKYGVTSRYVTGLEVVLPTGDIIDLGGKLRKDVTGYDLIHLLTGSEGTLGIFTKITLSLIPIPKFRAVLLALFRDIPRAIGVVPLLLRMGRIIPASVEYMDRLSLATSCEHLNETLQVQEAEALLLIEIDGSGEEEVYQDYETLGDLCFENGAFQVYVADNKTTMERVWRVRRNIAEALKVKNPMQSLEDIVVPIAFIPLFMDRLKDMSLKYGISIPCYGHAGDGNLHATILKPEEWKDNQWSEKLSTILGELYRITTELGGKISGEHGIGSKRREFISVNLSKETISLMKRIKKAFDPRGILNPGKIFP